MDSSLTNVMPTKHLVDKKGHRTIGQDKMVQKEMCRAGLESCQTLLDPLEMKGVTAVLNWMTMSKKSRRDKELVGSPRSSLPFSKFFLHLVNFLTQRGVQPVSQLL